MIKFFVLALIIFSIMLGWNFYGQPGDHHSGFLRVVLLCVGVMIGGLAKYANSLF